MFDLKYFFIILLRCLWLPFRILNWYCQMQYQYISRAFIKRYVYIYMDVCTYVKLAQTDPQIARYTSYRHDFLS